MLTTLLHQVARIRMSGALPLVPIYSFVAWPEKAFFFFLNSSAKVGYAWGGVWCL